MQKCLIVTAIAEEFAAEIARLADSPIPVKACVSTKQALAEYSDETILFGNPADIAKILTQMPTIEWIQSSWAGVTPLISHDRRDYVLTGVKGVFGPQMSEYVIGYLLAHELKVVERLQEQQKRNWLRTHSGVLAGKRIGIMGTGSIGQHIAETAKHFDMTTIGFSRKGTGVAGFDSVLPASELDPFLSAVDYLVSTLPDTSETDHLLNSDTLSKLPSHAYFINVGRSNIVDDGALMSALNNGSLAGAALDVFDEEPIPRESPLWTTQNLSVTAHIAAISHPLLIVPIFVENYRRYVNGEPLNHVVDFGAGY